MDQAYFVIIAIFLTIFGISYTFLTYRSKERLALVETGLDPDSFKKLAQRKGQFTFTIGLVFIGFSVGVISGFFLEQHLLVNYNPKHSYNLPQAYIAMVTFCTGLSMVIAFYITRRINK